MPLAFVTEHHRLNVMEFYIIPGISQTVSEFIIKLPLMSLSF